MKKIDKRKSHTNNKLRVIYIFSNNVRHPVTNTLTTLHYVTQLRFTPLHYTCRNFSFSHLNFTQLNFTTLSFGLNPFKFLTARHLTFRHRASSI